jgi:hypothetical protein
MKKLAVTVLQLLLPFSAFASSYYVTQSGAGSGNGLSVANAWSLAAFRGTSQPTGGDTVWFSGSFTSAITPGSNGTSATSHLTLDFSGATFSASLTNAGNGLISFTQNHDITINAVTYTGTSQGTQDFIDCGNNGGGIWCYDLTVQNCHLDNMCHFWTGSTTNNHDVLLLNNWFRTNVNTVTQTDVISTGDAYNVTIQGNFLCNQAPGNANLPAGNARHNDIIQNYQSGATPNAEPYNWVICFNWIEDDAGGDGNNSWTMLENNKGDPAVAIYSNVFVCTTSQPNNGVTFDSNDSSGKFYFYGNTCIANPGPNNIVRYLAPGTLYARNNVIVSQPGYTGTACNWTMNTGATWDYNRIYSSGGMDASDPGPHGSTANPMVSNTTGMLASNSPCLGTGDSSIGAPYNVGIATGATWPNPALVLRSASWDVGAFQSAPSPSQVQDFRQVSQ